jgi:hypothetical protein
MNTLLIIMMIYTIISAFFFLINIQLCHNIIDEIYNPKELTFKSLAVIIIFLPMWIFIFVIGTITFLFIELFKNIGNKLDKKIFK